MPELIMIDDWIDELPDTKHLIVFERACRALDIWVERQPDGTLQIEEDFDQEAITEAMGNEYKRMYAQVLLEDLAAEGKIRPDRVDGNGEIVYVGTEA